MNKKEGRKLLSVPHKTLDFGLREVPQSAAGGIVKKSNGTEHAS